MTGVVRRQVFFLPTPGLFTLYIDKDDPTTRRILEEILAVEEVHADDLLELKAEYNVKF